MNDYEKLPKIKAMEHDPFTKPNRYPPKIHTCRICGKTFELSSYGHGMTNVCPHNEKCQRARDEEKLEKARIRAREYYQRKKDERSQ